MTPLPQAASWVEPPKLAGAETVVTVEKMEEEEVVVVCRPRPATAEQPLPVPEACQAGPQPQPQAQGPTPDEVYILRRAASEKPNPGEPVARA